MYLIITTPEPPAPPLAQPPCPPPVLAVPRLSGTGADPFPPPALPGCPGFDPPPPPAKPVGVPLILVVAPVPA